MLDAVEPLATLGGELADVPPSKEEMSAADRKKKKKKKQAAKVGRSLPNFGAACCCQHCVTCKAGQ